MLSLTNLFNDTATTVIYLLTLHFFFNDTATTEIYTLSLHDALPISDRRDRELGGPNPRLRRLLGRRPLSIDSSSGGRLRPGFGPVPRPAAGRRVDCGRRARHQLPGHALPLAGCVATESRGDSAL